MATSNSAPANADVTAEDAKIGAEYDKAREQRVEDDAKASKKLGENRSLQGGVVVTGTEVLGTQSLFPGADRIKGVDKVDQGGAALRASKGLDTGGVHGDDTTWTAQSAKAYVADNAADVPGQTFRLDELPDPRVVAASSLPAHTIPADLVVDKKVTDNLNTSQERGGDLATGPKKDGEGDTTTARQLGDRKVKQP